MMAMKPDRERPRAAAGDFDLKRLQELLYRLIAAPCGVGEGLAANGGLPPGNLEAILNGDDRLSARERLEIYANAYFYRLLDVLKEEFAATLMIVGDVNFHNLVTGYLLEYPPTEPSILHAGRNLPAFIRTHSLSRRWPYLPDLARLERSLLEVFHGPAAPVLDASTMRQVPPHEWPALILRTHPASRILDLEWCVDLVMRAAEETGTRIEPPSGPTSVLVWRQGSRAHYRRLERGERAALALARDGVAFAMICEAIAAEATPDENPAALINRLLARWLSDGLVMAVGPWPASPAGAAS